MEPNILPYRLPKHQFMLYDPALPTVFAELATRLRIQAGLPRVEHIGSTAIPGMPGKNSINILVIVPEEEMATAVQKLEDFGFTEHPFKVEPEDRPFRVGGIIINKKEYWLHVHVVAEESPNHLDPLFFRDYLCAHPKVAQDYARLKASLAEKPLKSEEYNAAKQPFIREVLSRRVQSDKINE